MSDSRPSLSASIVVAWTLLALVIIITVVPVEYRPVTMLPLKVERGLGFAVLAAAFVLAYPRHFLVVIGGLSVAAFAIELLQYLIPSRDPRLLDALVKAAGAVLGGTLAKLFVSQRRKVE